MAQFAEEGVLSADAFGLQVAAGMNDNLVSPVLSSSPNGDETNSLRSTSATLAF